MVEFYGRMIIALQNDYKFDEIKQSKKKLLALRFPLLPNPFFFFFRFARVLAK